MSDTDGEEEVVDQGEEPGPELSSADLLEEIRTLHDLFKRRLLVDRQKQELYDRLYRELEVARKAVEDLHVMPLLRDLMLVVDRFDRYAGPGSELVEHAGEELVELLWRQGVEPVQVEPGDELDLSACEVIDVETVEDMRWHGRVLRISRRGYSWGDQVVRPAQVVLAQASQPAEDPDGQPEG